MNRVDELINSLDQLVTVYRHLLDIVRRENEVLVAADLKKMEELNTAKEKLVLKVRELDNQWQTSASQLARQLKMRVIQPTLRELSAEFSGERSQKMEQLHSVLNMLVKRISELNKRNESLVQSALAHITGAMDSITETLNENPIYGNKGHMDEENKDAQGRLVQREV